MTDLRTLERESIRAFVQSAADEGYLSGRVLDYGCGKQPYRDIVEAAGGHYDGYDEKEWPANVSGEDIGHDLMWDANAWDAILCTQVVQYLHDPPSWLPFILDHLFDNGVLVMTYPTNWPEVEPEDLHRFTKAGMERLLTEAGFTILRHERRVSVKWVLLGNEAPAHEEFALGYGVICRA